MGVRPFNVMSLGKANLLEPTKMGYQDSVDIISDELFKIEKSFVKVGWYLKHIRDEKLYEEGGYSNIAELAYDKFHFSQSTTSRFIKICERFSKNNNSPELDERYVEFDKSQMMEMLPLNEEQLVQVTPEMTVQQIREMKPKKKRKPNHTVLQEKCNEDEVNTSDEYSDEDNIHGQMTIEKGFPEYMPEDNINQEDVVQSYATSHKEELLCPPEIGSCIRQEWGTSPKEQEAGKKECEKCWQNSKERSKIISPEKECAENIITEDEEQIAPSEVPLLKNDNQRKEWLNNYKEWGLWYYDANIDVNYYKYDFPDGSRLIVTEYPDRELHWTSEKRDEYHFHLLEKGRKKYGGKGTYDVKYQHSTDSETNLIEFLRKLQKMI